VGSRGYTENFLDSPPNSRDMLYDQPRIVSTHQPVGIVREVGSRPLIDVRNPLQIGEGIEYLDKNLEGQYCRIAAMTDANGIPLERAHPGNQVFLDTEPPARHWSAHALLRRRCI
jgi:putative protease